MSSSVHCPVDPPLRRPHVDDIWIGGVDLDRTDPPAHCHCGGLRLAVRYRVRSDGRPPSAAHLRKRVAHVLLHLDDGFCPRVIGEIVGKPSQRGDVFIPHAHEFFLLRPSSHEPRDVRIFPLCAQLRERSRHEEHCSKHKRCLLTGLKSSHVSPPIR